MLKEILKLIYEGEKDLKEISKKLNLTEDQIKDRINHLIRLSYLDDFCEDKGLCKNCPLSKDCRMDLKMYQITKKGIELIEKY